MDRIPQLKKFLLLFNLALASIIFVGSVWVLSSPDNLFKSMLYGRFMGKTALGLLSLTLIPGIVKRFRLFPEILKLLMPLRRELGITMYLSVLHHWLFLFTLPNLAIGNFPPKIITPTVLFGLISAFVYLPLFLTSNDASQKKLKRNWAKLHRFTYLGLILLGIHLLLQPSKFALVAGSLVILEVASYAYTNFVSNKTNY